MEFAFSEASQFSNKTIFSIHQIFFLSIYSKFHFVIANLRFDNKKYAISVSDVRSLNFFITTYNNLRF